MSRDDDIKTTAYITPDVGDPKVTDFDPGRQLYRIKRTYLFLAWKNFEADLQLGCVCGALTRFEGMFAYALKCGHCGRVYDMPSLVDLVERPGTAPEES